MNKEMRDMIDGVDTLSTYLSDRSEHRVIANRANRKILRANAVNFGCITDTSDFPNFFKGRRVLVFTIPYTQADKDHAMMLSVPHHVPFRYRGCPVQYTSRLSN